MANISKSDTSNWRDKYFQLLDQQEKDQAKADAQSELLRKALVRVSLAADGLDPELDQIMGCLRDHLRAKDQGDAGLQAIMARLESTILAYEQRRGQHHEQLQESLRVFHQGLIFAARQRQNKPIIQQLKKQTSLLAAASTHPQQLGHLLDEQAAVVSALLQVQADDQAGGKGFFSRLFDRNEQSAASATSTFEVGDDDDIHVTDESNTDESLSVIVVENHIGAAENPDASVGADRVTPVVIDKVAAGVVDTVADVETGKVTAEAIIEGRLETREEVIEQEARQPEAIFQRPVHEPAFSRISDKILCVLHDLLDNIEPAECVVSRVQSARARIEAGLNWFELVPTLEDIRDLVMQAYLAAGKEFGVYLVGVDQALAEIAALLGVALAEQQRVLRIEQEFHAGLSSQLGAMSASVHQATDLNELKLLVGEHIVQIEQALLSCQKPVENNEAMVKLQARIRLLETEAKAVRDDLDLQRKKALRDPLTELPNREAYSERAYEEFVRWQRYQRPLTLAVCDIDHFKRINDNYGHQTGDRVLKVLSRGVSKRLREVDFMARYGGEEFVLLLPETTGEQALVLLDKIRETIAQTPFHFKEQPVQVTLSMGITELVVGDTVESAFARADKLLYDAKAKGRNCCLLSD